ncbi:transcription-repair coupling factor, partial [Nocardioides sp. GCM10030258]
MRLAGLADAVLSDPPLASALAEAAGASSPTGELTGPEALRPFLAAGLARAGRPLLVVTATTREAEQLVAELGDLLDPTGVAYYPSWETLPHERLSPRSDTVGRRLAVLRRLCHPGTDAATGPVNVIVAPVRSMLQPQVKGLGDLTPVELAVGGTADLDEVVAGLVGAAYSRVDLVEKRGEFAVRGGIVDVFPPTEEHPLRVEFWGEEVEEIRSFAVADQRTIAAVERLWAPPCRELLLTDDVRARAVELGRKHPQLLEITDKIAQGMAVEGMEALIPVLVDELELLVDLLPANTQVLVLDPERARARAHDLVATSEEFLAASWATAAVGGQAPIDLQAASYQSLGDVRSHARGLGQSWWTFSPFGLDGDADAAAPDQALGAQAAPSYRGDVEKA